jgi:Ser/Thr protein kinase RdoA (MazF antagonist)
MLSPDSISRNVFCLHEVKAVTRHSIRMMRHPHLFGTRAMAVAQYDDLDDLAITRLAHRALAKYPPELHGELKLLCRSENATFRLVVNGRRFALRLHRDKYHSKTEIESELDWLDALRRDTGIVVPEAIEAADGARVVTISDDNGAGRHADLFHWIDGEEPTNAVDPLAFRTLGEITARLHQHSRAWSKPEGFRRLLWTHESMVGPDGHWGAWSDMSDLSARDQQIVREATVKVAEALTGYGKSPDRFGLIHADLRLTNLLLHQGETRVIDFDDCGMGWYLHDLAAAVSFEEHHPSAPRWIENWLRGYERVAHIDDASLSVLPSVLIQRRIQLTAWMASHAQTETAKGLADQWAAHTVRLSRRYLDGDVLPLG